jgi:hypothetical protein
VRCQILEGFVLCAKFLASLAQAPVVAWSGADAELFDVLAGAVPVAVARAVHALAALATKTFEALAFTRRAITDSFACAFRVLVKRAILVRSVSPGNLCTKGNSYR